MRSSSLRPRPNWRNWKSSSTPPRPSPPQGERANVLIEGIVDLTVDRRRAVNTILSDPIVVGFFAGHERWRDVMHRLRRLLIGEDAGPEARVRTAMLVAAISGAATHPFVADLDDDVLRVELLRLARRFLGLPG